MTLPKSCQRPCGEGVRIALTHYPPALVQPSHRHDFSQFSFLLAGHVQEQAEGRTYEAECRGMVYKPAGSFHANRWGRDGALMFSINLPPAAAELLAEKRSPGWGNLDSCIPIAPLLRICFEGDAESRSEAIHDLLALATPAVECLGAAPPWLKRAREALRDDASLTVEELARLAGVHRAYFSRAFQRRYGIPPSVHRRKLLLARALSRLVEGESSLSAVAHEAGFSDHAHMGRTLRTEVGFAPRHLRSLLHRGITSIQDDLTVHS